MRTTTEPTTKSTPSTPLGGKSRVTNNDKDDSEPSFSPDGKRIAYVASDGNNFEIYTINVGGGDKTQVTNNDTADYGLSWGRRR